jgi:hypothetical protein
MTRFLEKRWAKNILFNGSFPEVKEKREKKKEKRKKRKEKREKKKEKI